MAFSRLDMAVCAAVFPAVDFQDVSVKIENREPVGLRVNDLSVPIKHDNTGTVLGFDEGAACRHDCELVIPVIFVVIEDAMQFPLSCPFPDIDGFAVWQFIERAFPEQNM